MEDKVNLKIKKSFYLNDRKNGIKNKHQEYVG